MKYILGISCYYHDSAAALISDEMIIALAQEERFSRIKHDPNFPVEAVKYCLAEANISLKDLDSIVFYDKPFLKFERIIETHIKHTPIGLGTFIKSMPVWLGEKLLFRKKFHEDLNLVESIDKKNYQLKFSQHHLSHAASTYFTSNYENSCVLTIDGVGEWATATIAKGDGNQLNLLREMSYPNSLGLFYSAFTYFCGFKVNSGEYKLMGLAPYGRDDSDDFLRFYKIIKDTLISINKDGALTLNQNYFTYSYSNRMLNKEKIEKLLGLSIRTEDMELKQEYCDLALAVQRVTEDVVMAMAKYAKEITKSENLCISGGVALNCVANGKLLKEKVFSNIWIQPAAGDAGGALGAALAYLYDSSPDCKRLKFEHSFWGQDFSDRQIINTIKNFGLVSEKLDENDLCERIANDLSDSNIVGWFQGRMEWGPRALGHRSILADPTDIEMQKKLNLKIKFRESFRPFAPIVFKSKAKEIFELEQSSDYMLFTMNIRKDMRIPLPDDFYNLSLMEKLNTARSKLPAITHMDYSARVQTVDEKTNARFVKLLKEFEKKKGFPVLVNTSFNVRGEPIVRTPKDAINCFINTHMDVLVLENFVIYKNKQGQEIQESVGKQTFAKD